MDISGAKRKKPDDMHEADVALGLTKIACLDIAIAESFAGLSAALRRTQYVSITRQLRVAPLGDPSINKRQRFLRLVQRYQMACSIHRSERKCGISAACSHGLDFFKPPHLLALMFPGPLWLCDKSRLAFPLHRASPLQVPCGVASKVQITLVEEHVDAMLKKIQNLRLHAEYQIPSKLKSQRNIKREPCVVGYSFGYAKRFPNLRHVHVVLYPLDLWVAELVFRLAPIRDIKSVATSCSRLSIVKEHNAFHAYVVGCETDGWIRVLVAHVDKCHTTREVGSYDVATGLVEYGSLHTGVRSAQRFPETKVGVPR